MRLYDVDGSSYASGDHNNLPVGRTVFSSSEVLDQVISWFDATYPNLHQIVVAAHSLGGQATQYVPAVSLEDLSQSAFT